MVYIHGDIIQPSKEGNSANCCLQMNLQGHNAKLNK